MENYFLPIDSTKSVVKVFSELVQVSFIENGRFAVKYCEAYIFGCGMFDA
jgi:hypothetical protein